MNTRTGILCCGVLLTTAALAFTQPQCWAAGGPGGGGGGGGQSGGSNQTQQQRGSQGGGGQGGSSSQVQQRRGSPGGGGQAQAGRRAGQGQMRGGQRGPQAGGPRGMGPQARGRWGYQRAAEASFEGVVIESPARGSGAGLAAGFTLRAANGEVRRVRLGPPWYVDQLGLDLRPDDPIRVIGAPDPGAGQGAIVGRELWWRGHIYRLRTEEGAPVWSGARRPGWVRYGNLWNPSHMVRVTGEIEAVEGLAPGGRDMGQGIALRLRVRDRTRERTEGQPDEPIRERARDQLQVHLGPFWYVEDKLPGLRLGQEVIVEGSSSEWNGGEVIIASKLERNQERLQLREQNGMPAWAGGWQNWDGWGPGSRYGSLYDPNRVGTIAGVVESVRLGSPMGDMGRGMLVRVRTHEGNRVQAHLGPTWFSEQAEISLNPGDEVTLTGSTVRVEGREMLMVREMTTAQRQIRLREDDGAPVWAGRRVAPTEPPEKQPSE